MSAENILKGLDAEQKKAVTLKTNGVASAGAGSGKTKALASRYAWLIMEGNLRPEEIITLTFTNKAVSEMYSRIYRYLLEQANPNSNGAHIGSGPDEPKGGDEKARAALKEFHKARIGTLDSFSAGIARTAAARYGISPEFSSDDTALRDMAREAALAFVLDNREDPAIRELLADCKIRKLSEEIFAQVVLRYSPISSPLDFDGILAAQKEAILNAWEKKSAETERIAGLIADALRALAAEKKSIAFTEALADILLKSPQSAPQPAPPDIAPLLETALPADSYGDAEFPAAETRRQLREYFARCSALAAVRLPGRYGEAYAPVVEYFRILKGKDGAGLFHELEALANCALNFGVCGGIFKLLEKFQDEFNAKKRETGFLSFGDIARLAVDALRDHPDIRKAYKDSLKMIMIDEFQDNNALQRDLIYLLAENPERLEKGVPSPAELEKDRMFFVGDEKQSIYRFRGADVAVFRSLGKDLFGQKDPSRRSQADDGIELKRNYRSRPGLIAAFNRIFGGSEEDAAPGTARQKGVFLPPGPDVPDYEAVYTRILPPENQDENGEGPLAHFCFLNGEGLPDADTGGVKSHDLEAVFIAGKIRGMVAGKEKIPKRKEGKIEWVECAWNDFAVLERSYARQSVLEKYFREFGVPYSADRPAGLFNDAPILDLRAYLRLLVYPEDRIAYAALIRSPFMRLGDLTLSVCMLNKGAEPFAEENEAFIPNGDLELYRRARASYQRLREASQSLPVTELLAKLWYEEGYRFETLWSESAQVYESLFDLFFSLASDTDRRGKSLADFIEYLEDVINREEKPDNKDIPGEGEPGVRIMSIHKSKGLEFPVAFIFDGSHSGSARGPSTMASFHEKYGLILNIPQAEELPSGGNYFRDIFAAEEKAKDLAELRRLLYVAMTRAEYKLFLTFTMPKQTKEEKKEWDMADEEFAGAALRRRLAQLAAKSKDNPDTFLKLLAPVLPGCPDSLCSLEAIPALARAEISARAAVRAGAGGSAARVLNQREAAIAAEAFYEKAELLPVGEAGPASLEASKLRYRRREKAGSTGGPPEGFFETGQAGREENELDRLLEKTGIDAAAFGSLVHAALEGRLNGRPAAIPGRIRSRLDEERAAQKILAEAEALADTFLASDLGKSWAASSYRESEFPVITSAAVKGRTIPITGQIDLLYGEGGEIDKPAANSGAATPSTRMTIVDFKTDKMENPEDHYGQLAAYCRAAEDIFGKPVSAWLFYLRSGRAVDVTEAVKNVSLEALAQAALLDG